MKKISIILLLFFLSDISLCQEYISPPIRDMILPYEVIGTRTLELSGTYFADHMEGKAALSIMIDNNCKLLNFSIMFIKVSDDTNANTFIYRDPNQYGPDFKDDPNRFKKSYYPAYIHQVYDSIKVLVDNLKFEYVKDGNVKEINHLGLILKIK